MSNVLHSNVFPLNILTISIIGDFQYFVFGRNCKKQSSTAFKNAKKNTFYWNGL